jgi:hypothetical protein
VHIVAARRDDDEIVDSVRLMINAGQRHGGTGTQRRRDAETQRNRDAEKETCKEIETWRGRSRRTATPKTASLARAHFPVPAARRHRDTATNTSNTSTHSSVSSVSSASSNHSRGPLTRPLIRRVAPLVHARGVDVDIARVEQAGRPVVEPDLDGSEDDDDVA